MLGATILPAQAQSTHFNSITDFGDSYADTGFAPGGVLRLPPGNFACPNGPPQLPTCRFTGGTNFVDSLQSLYRLPLATNFAFGGARTDTTNTTSRPGFPQPGFAQELANFVASGRHFTNSDLIALSIGGNDLSLAFSTNSIAQVDTLATASGVRAVAGVQQLVADGARNIVWLSPGNSVYFPVPPDGQDAPLPLTTGQRDAFAHTYFQEIQRLLAPVAHSGVRVFLFDFETLQARIAADPGQYGFASAGGCQALLGVNPCLASPSAVQNSFFYFNTVHPTSAGMALIASYMANQIDAPLTVVPQGRIATGIAADFATSVFGRLDAYRPYLAGGRHRGPAASEGPWSVYAEVNGASGSLDRQFLSAGYDGEAVGATFGIEYQVDPRLRLGGLFGYSASDITLDVQNAHNHIDAYQFALYGSFTDTSWFADALIAYGRDDFAIDRLGVIDTVRAGTSANAFTTAGKAGYLFDIGPVRAGPMAGLDYAQAIFDPYTETGDSLVTMMVGHRALDNLTGDAGLQMRVPFALGGGLYSPFINITAEHDFLGSGRFVTTTQVTTPLLPVVTPVSGNGGAYGKIAAGIAAPIAGNLSATLNMAATFARAGGNDLSVGTGFNLSF